MKNGWKVGYFYYNGVKYPTGTEFLMNLEPDANGKVHQRVCTFLFYNKKYDVYVSEYIPSSNSIYGTNQPQYICRLNREKFYANFAGVTGSTNSKYKPLETKQKSDSQIDGMVIGWMWYIAMMIVVTIFKQRVLGWIALTIIFFVWRHSKIKKEGYYYEW